MSRHNYTSEFCRKGPNPGESPACRVFPVLYGELAFDVTRTQPGQREYFKPVARVVLPPDVLTKP